MALASLGSVHLAAYREKKKPEIDFQKPSLWKKWGESQKEEPKKDEHPFEDIAIITGKDTQMHYGTAAEIDGFTSEDLFKKEYNALGLNASGLRPKVLTFLIGMSHRT